MRREDIISCFEDGINTVYGWYEQGNEPKRPFRVLHYLSSQGMNADDTRYYPVDRWQLDLVTDKKDEDAETSTETALLARGLVFSKTEDLQDVDVVERRCRVIYRFNTIGG